MAKKDMPVTYCMATFYLNVPKNPLQKENETLSLVDESAILSQLTADTIKIISTKHIEKELLQSITMSIVDGRNAYLLINGPVLEVTKVENGFLYEIQTPQKQQITLGNGITLDIECQAISKYFNIHKPKRVKKEAKVT